MKFIKLALAVALGLAGIQQASADVEIHLVGSTAFRAATINAIINRLGSPVGVYDQATGSSISGSNFAVISGTYTGLGTVTVRCAWSGSVAGIQSVTGGANVAFISTPKIGAATVTPTAVSVSGSVATGGAPCNKADSTLTAALKPEVTMADNYQVSTIYRTPNLTDNIVGVVPFAIVCSANAPAGVTNVGPNALKALFTQGGYLSAEILTGNTADHASFGGTDGTLMYAIGRDNGSGTRVTAFAESGIGVLSSVNQFTANATLTGFTITGNTVAHIVEDTRGLNGSTVDPGNGGESSGGTLADQIRFNTSSVADDTNGNDPRPIAYLTYLGESDSYRATAGAAGGSGVTGANAANARYVSYNGVKSFDGTFFNDVATTNSTTLLTAAGSANPATAFAGMLPGQVIRGANIPADTVIVSVNSAANPNTITMSNAATGSSSALKVTVGTLIGTPIRLGTYTFWGYEHIMWTTFVTDGFGTAADKSTISNAIKTQIATGGYTAGAVDASNKGDYFATGLANDAAMTVARTADGGPVTAKY